MILIGPVIIIAVLMALAVPRLWRKLTVPRCEPQGRIAIAPGPRAVTP
jgi:hypothetical protein